MKKIFFKLSFRIDALKFRLQYVHLPRFLKMVKIW